MAEAAQTRQEGKARSRAVKQKKVLSTKNVRRTGSSILRWIIYLALAWLFLMPFIWMILGSLRLEREIFANLYPFSWRTFVPIEWTLDNYLDVLGLSAEGQRFGFNFGRNLLNSFIISTITGSTSNSISRRSSLLPFCFCINSVFILSSNYHHSFSQNLFLQFYIML